MKKRNIVIKTTNDAQTQKYSESVLRGMSMGFHIIYREMKEYYRELERWSQSMQNICEKLYQKLQKLVVSSGMQGEAAEAIRTYIGKVHFPIIKGLLWMLEEL